MNEKNFHFQGWSGVRLYDDPILKLFVLAGWGRSFIFFSLANRGSTGDSLSLQILSGVVLLRGEF